MKIRKLFGIGVVLLVCTSLMLGGCGQKVEEVAPPAVASVSENKSSIDVFGTVNAKNKSVANVNFTAKVKKINVSLGQRVKKGDVMVELDVNDYLLQIDSKNSALNAAQIEIKKLQNSKTLENIELSDLRKDLSKKQAELNGNIDVDVQKLENDLAIAKLKLANLQDEYKMKEILVQKSAANKKELDAAKLAMNEGEINVNSAILNIESLKSNRQKEITDLNLKVKQKEQSTLAYDSQVEDQQNKIDILVKEIAQMDICMNSLGSKDGKVICSVEDGIVSEINYTEGENASEDKPICVIMDAASLYIKSDVPEEFIKDIKVGIPATIVPVADKTKQFTGKVSRIYDIADSKDGETNIPVEITVDDAASVSLMLNSNVDIKIGGS